MGNRRENVETRSFHVGRHFVLPVWRSRKGGGVMSIWEVLIIIMRGRRRVLGVEGKEEVTGKEKEVIAGVDRGGLEVEAG